MRDELIFDVDTAGAIKAAALKAGANPVDLKRLAEDHMFEAVLPVIRGFAQVKEVDFTPIGSALVAGRESFCAENYLESSRVGFMTEFFRQFFLNKEEQNIDAATISVNKLRLQTYDAALLAKLGDWAEIKLAQLFALMAIQSGSEDGLLATYWNDKSIAYIRGIDKNIWSVQVYPIAGPAPRLWGLAAESIDTTVARFPGNRVLSR